MIHAWGITDKGAVRTQNQDGFYLDVPSEHLAVGVVCDGMGGAKAGNIASLIAVETFVDALQGMQPDGDGEAGPAAVLSRAAETAQLSQSILSVLEKRIPIQNGFIRRRKKLSSETVKLLFA